MMYLLLLLYLTFLLNLPVLNLPAHCKGDLKPSPSPKHSPSHSGSHLHLHSNVNSKEDSDDSGFTCTPNTTPRHRSIIRLKESSMPCSNAVDESSVDIRRALSLLSNNSWASSCCESDLITINHNHTINATNQTQTGIQTFPPQGLPLSSSHYWQVDHQSNDPHLVTVASKTSTPNTHYQGPYESRFYPSMH